VAPRILGGVQDVDDVAAVSLPADVQQALDVLDLAEGLDDVRGGVGPDEPDPLVEVRELAVFDRVHAVLLQDLHRVAPVLLEAVGVRRPAGDGLPLLAEFPDQFPGTHVGTDSRGVAPLARSGTLLDVGSGDPDVVEDDDVRPPDLRVPVVGLRDDPVADLPVARGLDVVRDVVALPVDLPRQVG
jgi:hypothetical protein